MKIKPLALRNGAFNEARTEEANGLSIEWSAAKNAAGSNAIVDPNAPQNLPPTAGTIAFTGFNADGNDDVAFVALDEIAIGTVIYFTDNEWNGTAFADQNEGLLQYTVTSTIAAGSIVTLSSLSAAATRAATFGTLTQLSANPVNLNTGDEVLYAYVANSGTPTVPVTFLAAIANGGFSAANGLLTGTGLTDGTHAVNVGAIDDDLDIAAYTGLRTGQASLGGYLSSINNASNWVAQDGSGNQDQDTIAPDIPFSTTGFTVAGGTPNLTIDDVSTAEGDSGTVILTFTVSLSAPAGAGGVTFDIQTADNTATTADNDYVPRVLTSQTIPVGSSTYTFDVTVNGDDLPEDTETFFVNVLNVTGATVTDGQGQGTITNDDAFGSLSIGDVTLAEGDSGTTAFTFTVLRSGGDDGAVGATWTLDAPGGANLADLVDFAPGQPTTGTVSFADGETSQTITILVQGDVSFEDTETFLVVLSAPTGGVALGNVNGTGEITNDDAAPAGTLDIADASVTEGDSGPATITFTVTRTGGSAGPVTADYVISAPGGAGNADASDFVSGAVFSGQVSFADGQTSQTITIDVQGDADFEGDENFTVTLSNATGGAVIGDDSATGTIQNDDINTNPGDVSIGDAAILEGDGAGTVTLQFTVTRSGGTAAFSVDFASSDGGIADHAIANAPGDYLANSGTLNFADGQLTAVINITVNSDDLNELSEELTVTLSNATNGATLTDATGIGTITTDDIGGTIPTGVWINEVHYDDAGTDTGEFVEIAAAAGTDLTGWTLALYNGNPSQLSVYATINLSGTIPNQAGGFGTLSFPGPGGGIQNGGTGANGEPDGIALVNNLGQVVEFISYEGVMTAASGPASGLTSVNVGVYEPADVEGSSIGRTGGPSSTWAYFTDDTPGALNTGQSIAPAPTLSVTDVSVNENAGTMTFTVTRTNVVPGAFSVNYATADGTALAGSDYTATSGVLNFADNQTQATVTVTLSPDAVAEFDETLFLNLSNATNGALIEDNQAVGTILNDDGQPIIISINNVVQAEGLSGTTTFVFTVTRSGGTDAFSVDFATADGTATVAGNDYVANSGTLNFGIGQDTATISVTVNGDMTPEAVESFAVNLSNASSGVIVTDASGSGTILDGDGAVTFIHDIQGTAYFSPLLAGEGITSFNVASAGIVTVTAIVTAVDNVGNRQGFYIQEEITDWDGNSYTSEGIFVMTRNDAGVGNVVAGITVGDLVTVSANVMEYQGFASNMPITALVNPSAIAVQSSGNALPAFLLDASHAIPSSIMTGVTPVYTDSVDDVGDSFDASLYGLSYWETVEGMLVTIPDMVVADGFVSTSGGQPFMQAYSTVHADASQINSRGGYTIAGDPPNSPPNTANPEDGTTNGGLVLHDGDVNPDIVELDWTGWADNAPAGLSTGASMGDLLGDITGIIDFEFTDRKLFVTDMEVGGWVNTTPTIETTTFGGDSRSLTVATFNVENLDPTDGAARFTALANAIKNNLNSPDIICIEEMQDNNGATSSGGADASTTWGMLVAALNLATGKVYQWVDQEPTAGAEGGEPGGNIRVGFLYDTGRVQLGNLDANATLAERRQYTDRIGDGVRDAGDLIAFDDSMLGGQINTADWATTRRSLLGEFHFNGNTVYVTANHWPAKGGSGDFWQFDQDLEAGDPDNSDWAQRNEVAQDVWSMMNLIQGTNANAGIVAGGDFNDFYFYRPLEVLTGYVLPDGSVRSGGARFDNLTLSLAEAERYTYTFDGRSQAIDHIIANQLLSAVATYDVVHLNTGFNPTGTPALSDHDPGIATFDYRNFSETLNGSGAGDVILGFGGNDTISGNGGADLLVGGAGVDTLRGGEGDDTYVVEEAADAVLETSGQGNDVVYASASYALAMGSEVEILSTLTHASTTAINLTGNSGNQLIIGNFGNNLLNGGLGADTLYGLYGDDTYIVHDAQALILEEDGAGTDLIFTSLSYTLTPHSSVEVLSTNTHASTAAINLTGNGGNQTIIGNNGSNVLNGGVGADLLYGLGGDDFYIVFDSQAQAVEFLGGGNDTVFTSVSWTLTAGSEVEAVSTSFHGGTDAINLTGNELANGVYGNNGANLLNGGGGNDSLLGFGGADTFAFTTALGAGNVDTLGDFLSGTDRIALDDAIFTQAGGLGALNANAFVTGTAAQDGSDRIVYNSATGQLFYDADGAGGAAQVLFATLSPGAALTAGDFVVI